MGDPLFLQMKQHNSAAGVVGRVKKVLRRRYQHRGIALTRHRHWQAAQYRHRPGFTDFVRLLSGYDAIIQVGGSFLSISMACRSLNMHFARLWRKSRCL